MTTYEISVNGKLILENVSKKDLKETVKLIRGLVWLTGGSESDIEVVLNKLATD